MKKISCLLFAILGIPLALSAQPPFNISPTGQVDPDDLIEATRRPATREQATDAQLEAIKAKSQIKYGKDFKPTDGLKARPIGDYYANSIILSDGKDHTVLPHSSILCLPPAYQERVITKPKGDLILWPEFLKQNWQWIRAYEVTFATAKGEVPIPEPVSNQFSRSGRVIVSVLRKNPISVLMPPPPSDGTEEKSRN
ncbi:MAG: hypothetical protein ACI8UO_004259 [Verrucomicrobiales bacterium]|jgi:hypothetical protein